MSEHFSREALLAVNVPAEKEKDFADSREKMLELRSTLKERLKDPSYLPSFAEVRRAFYYRKEPDKVSRAMFDRGGFWEFRNDPPLYEILNKEYMKELAAYLATRASNLGRKPVTILEVGAGSGRLSHFLRERLEKLAWDSVEVKIIATDSGEWEVPIEPAFPVEKLDAETAVQKYKPDIVIASWMPPDVDWTQSFRNTKEVQEYILIGEAGGGCCGDNWYTWGMESFRPETETEEIVPYERDGFRERDLEMQYQIGRTDEYGIDEGGSYSRTISFKRLMRW